VGLSDAQIELYSRQILLPELGGRGQRRLLESSCLVYGAPRESEALATYLVGSGIGRIDLALRGGPAASRGSSYAPLERRNPDTVVSVVHGERPVRLGAYDVAILALARLSPHDCSRLAGSARQGTILLREEPAGRQQLLLLPSSDSGCFACVRIAADAPSHRADQDPILPSLGAAMAALAALRWLAELAREERVRALVLSPDSGIWNDVATQQDTRCSRGCRP
jgi:hypothetical protein